MRIDGRYDLEAGTRIGSRLQRLAEALRRQDDKAARDGGGTGGGEGRRSWDQLQADALDQLASGDAGQPGNGGGGSGPKAEVIVVADIGVLTGENPAGRCEIPGVGPVPPEVLQRIACDAELTGVLFSEGKPLFHGATVRTATKAQWRMLIARDGGCIGCGAEPRWCQAHHTVPYAQSRRTGIDQLVLVCWRCHHNIHDHNWRITHHHGKPALQPPDPADTRPSRHYDSGPASTAASTRPSHGHDGRDARNRGLRPPPPGRSRPPPTDQADPDPSRTAPGCPNPDRDRVTDQERAPALFPT